jgi:hypothetical protein
MIEKINSQRIKHRIFSQKLRKIMKEYYRRIREILKLLRNRNLKKGNSFASGMKTLKKMKWSHLLSWSKMNYKLK